MTRWLNQSKPVINENLHGAGQFCCRFFKLIPVLVNVGKFCHLMMLNCGSCLEELYSSHCHLVDLRRTVKKYPALQILDVSFNKVDDVKQLVCFHFFIFWSELLAV